MKRPRHSAAWIAITLSWGAVNAAVLADAVGYARVFDCRAESADLVAEHHHDWSEATRELRWKMISTDRNVLGADNIYSFVRVTEKRSGRELFRAPSPALSHLWISPDSRFVVGVSNIKLWNPLQVVVFDAKGEVLLAKPVGASTFPGVLESVTNSVRWYKEPAPRISLDASGESVVLVIEGNAGADRRFEFHAQDRVSIPE